MQMFQRSSSVRSFAGLLGLFFLFAACWLALLLMVLTMGVIL